MSLRGRTFTRVHSNDSCSSQEEGGGGKKGYILGNGLLNFHRNESSLKYRFRPGSFHLSSLPFSPLQGFSPFFLSPFARLKSFHNAVSPPNGPSSERSMIKRKTSVHPRRDRYLTFFEIPSVTTKLVGTRKKGKGDGPVGALISWGLRQLLPAERRKVLDLRWYLGYLLSRWHDLFRSLRHVAATDRIPKFGMAMPFIMFLSPWRLIHFIITSEI